jgi:hypothetical protein
MIVQIELQLSKCTRLVQYVGKIWCVEREDIYVFCGERHVNLIMEKHLMRYPKCTIDYGPKYISDYEIRFAGLCYPRYLGITRRSCLEAHMVLDMEYREQERPEHGPGGPIFFFSASFVLSAVPASITTGLGLHQKRLLLHEVIGPRYHGMCHI